MNTPPYNFKAAYEAQRDGVAEVYDDGQVDHKKSDLPRTKLANEAMNLARSMHDKIDPGDVDDTRIESPSTAFRPSTLEHAAHEEVKPMLPSEFLLGIGKRIETLRLIRMDSTNDKNKKGTSGSLGRAA